MEIDHTILIGIRGTVRSSPVQLLQSQSLSSFWISNVHNRNVEFRNCLGHPHQGERHTPRGYTSGFLITGSRRRESLGHLDVWTFGHWTPVCTVYASNARNNNTLFRLVISKFVLV
jgi:hypothetical protein